MRIQITMPDILLKELDSHCNRVHDDRSGVIAEAVRSLLYLRGDTIHTVKRNDMQNTHTLHNIPPAPQEKGPILEVPVPEISEKVKNIAAVMKKTAKAPMFCPKHNGMRVGLTYSCGCSV